MMVCCVCDETVDDSTSADCYGCGQRYHLNQRNDVPGKDCGDVWLSDVSMALEFACQTCVDASNGAPQAATADAPPAPAAGASGEPTRKRRYRRWE